MSLNTFNIDITAKKAGTTNITVEAQAANGEKVTKTIAVTVKDKTTLTAGEDVSNPISMTMDDEPKKIIFNTTAARLTIENTAEQYVKGEIDAEDNSGKTVKITAVDVGTGKVKVKATEDGKAEAVVEITVVVVAQKVTTELTLNLTDEAIELVVDDVKTIVATTNATDITVTSENSEFATAEKKAPAAGEPGQEQV